MMGVDRRTPGKWARSGRITLVGDLIDPEAAKAQLQATGSPQPHHMARRARIDQNRGESSEQTADRDEDPDHGAGEPPAGAENVGMRLQLARARYEENRADVARLDRDQKAGLLILRADADFVMDDLGRRLANLLDRLADQLTPKILGLKGDSAAVHAALVEAGRDLRIELAHHMQQQSQGFKP